MGLVVVGGATVHTESLPKRTYVTSPYLISYIPCDLVTPPRPIYLSDPKQQALKHQANDKLPPDINTFLGWGATGQKYLNIGKHSV